jgi:hypothetical protein
MNLLKEIVKADIAMVTELANAADHTGRYVGFGGFRKMLFVIGVQCDDGILDTETVTATIIEGKNNAGLDHQNLIEDVIITGLVDGSVVQTDLAATAPIENGDTVTINGVEFTKAAANDIPEGEFLNAAGLVLCIAAHLPELAAVANGNVVTISHAEVGAGLVTLVETAGLASAWVPAGGTTYALALAEVSSEQLSTGFSHIAVNVENGATGNIVSAAFVIRSNPYHAPVYHAVAAEGSV